MAAQQLGMSLIHWVKSPGAFRVHLGVTADRPQYEAPILDFIREGHLIEMGDRRNQTKLPSHNAILDGCTNKEERS
jgi:hypothetical protein